MLLKKCSPLYLSFGGWRRGSIKNLAENRYDIIFNSLIIHLVLTLCIEKTRYDLNSFELCKTFDCDVESTLRINVPSEWNSLEFITLQEPTTHATQLIDKLRRTISLQHIITYKYVLSNLDMIMGL